MGRLKGTHYEYKHVNGRGRNEVVKCTPEELAEMAQQLNSTRNFDGKRSFQRRQELVKKRNEVK